MTADRGRIARQLVTAVTAVLLAVGMSACASGSTTTPSATGGSSVASSSPAASAPSEPSASVLSVPSISKDATSASAGQTGPTTLTGVVTEGVESGCVVLTDDAGAVLANLMGLDTKAAPIGSTVEVTGEFEDLMTTCQQGKPFTVTAVEVQK